MSAPTVSIMAAEEYLTAHQEPLKRTRKRAKLRWWTVVRYVRGMLALEGFVVLIIWLVGMRSGAGNSVICGYLEEKFCKVEKFDKTTVKAVEVNDALVISGNLDGNFSEVEEFVKTIMETMQVKVNAVFKKIEDVISIVRKEFDDKMEKMGDETDLKLKTLDVRSDAFEKFMDEFRSNSLLSKEEFAGFFEEFEKARKNGGTYGGDVSVDGIRDFARQIVGSEIERHAADGLGMVDYALASGGGLVLRHSEPYDGIGSSEVRSVHGYQVHAEAEKMIRPSFGEPGQCFPFKGGSGFVEIRLRTAIVPEAVTLEHVAKCVDPDRSSAPKQCKVSGWMQGPFSSFYEIYSEKMQLLTEFTYDLEKSNAQTFKVEPTVSDPVDTIRLDFTSNHGSASHTCIYRVRVHGHERNRSLSQS